MSRELKRVPLDFDWPMNMVWKGYLNPYHSQECKACKGSGLNPATKKLEDDWYTHSRTDGEEGWMYHLEQEDVQALLDHGRLWDFTRRPINDEQKKILADLKAQGKASYWLPSDNGYIPTPEEVNKWARQAGISGHDSCNQWICVEARAKRLGVYGKCSYCNGEGHVWFSNEVKKLSEEWESYEPPTGEGYQLWENCSEGSPVSPVFETLDELCEWCETGATTFGSAKTSKEEWKRMLDEDFVVHKQGNMVFM